MGAHRSPRRTADAPSPRPHFVQGLVAKDCFGQARAGSGVVIDKNHLLSCWHVVVDPGRESSENPWGSECNDIQIRETGTKLEVVHADPIADLALLRFPEESQHQGEIATWLDDASLERWQTKQTRIWSVYGWSPATQDYLHKTGSGQRFESREDVQVFGGIPKGFSGGALMLGARASVAAPRQPCLGMPVQGGERGMSSKCLLIPKIADFVATYPSAPPVRLQRVAWRDPKAHLAPALGATALCVSGLLGLLVWSTHEKNDAPHPPTSIVLPGGPFTMGTDDLAPAFTACTQAYRESEERAICQNIVKRESPARTLSVAPFAMDRTEVSNADFLNWVGSRALRQETRACQGHTLTVVTLDGHVLLRLGDTQRKNYPTLKFIEAEERLTLATPESANLPVAGVSWWAANKYCHAQAKRLPSESEWAYAARGAHGRLYPGEFRTQVGDSIDMEDLCTRAHIGRGKPPHSKTTKRPCNGDHNTPRPINKGHLDRSPAGLWDMTGNVSEWTSTPWPGRERNCHAGDCFVAKGASWEDPPVFARAATRNRFPDQCPPRTVGFRCAADLLD